ncbi:MAG: DUF4242 domain-containing protein [bacterium]
MRLRTFMLVLFGLIATIVLLGCKKEPEKRSSTHLYMDIHKNVSGLTAEAVAGAHKKDLEVQGKHGVSYLKYWYDEGSGTVFCLVEAPNKEAAAVVHKEAHGLVADEIVEVKEGH